MHPALTTPLIVLAAAASLQASPGGPPRCIGGRSAPALDHVVLAVDDLDRASAPFLKHGFRLKHGRLHANGLANRHIKFRDGSSIELMTLRGEPGDAMAERYAALLAAGGGGVYAAFRGPDLEGARRLATGLGLETHRSSSGPWRFLGFPGSSPAAAVFFSSGGAPASDPDSLSSHRPGVHGLAEVWLEGGPELQTLLEKLGAGRCGPASFAGVSGERLALSRGTVVVVPRRPGVRPRVLGVVVRSESADGVIRPHARFWMRYRPWRDEPPPDAAPDVGRRAQPRPLPTRESPMAFDEKLAERIRARLDTRAGVAERKMFGGMIFMLHGNMRCGVHRDVLIARVGPGEAASALAEPHTRMFDLTGRPMKAWVQGEPPGLATGAQLGRWVDRAAQYAGSLPPR
jgi:hypothetical protein